ncbi:Na+/H+ antiporter NhaC family protein [Priestia flexa]|uniref:Na+/H+ antiporter NhaC family protein n=1 Tax=Priestia flexa TaxID=86664 RepID=UPI0010FBC8E6|nr:Na+/H+ antiporter NhaC family protein [Priestia flexa]QCS51538.1 Na+/H+ antiporter NhaC family protein [Priestia flexa]
MEGTIFSLLPPLIAILMVVLTRKVLLSLGVGILAGGLVLTEFSVGETIQKIWGSFATIFYADGVLNTSNLFILLFLLILGVITAFISIIGGSRAFGEWALQRIKTRRGAHLLTAVLGIIIFIDDYFNALAVGQVSRPVTDRQRVSRAKLAYLIDSTSAPVCVIAPFSSWGAYIITVVGSILAAHGMSNVSAFSAFVQMIPMNFYVFTALIMVFVVSVFDINIGPMKKHEERAIRTGEVTDPEKGAVPGELKEDLPVSENGRVFDLILPIIVLMIGTIGAMLWTGYQATEGQATIFTMFENTNVPNSLMIGGLSGLVVTLVLFIARTRQSNELSNSVLGKGIVAGIKSMLPAIYILLLAWMIGDLIGQLKSGEFLAGIVESSNLNIAFLPVVLFIIAGIMAFSTGTSWGTFGIMLPIAGDIVGNIEPELLLPALAAVLAGSVCGDHCSPISDTTILSSTGAGSHHIDHVMTQLPYAIISAVISIIGYIVLGLTESTAAGFGTIMVLLVVFVLVTRKKGNITETSLEK